MVEPSEYSKEKQWSKWYLWSWGLIVAALAGLIPLLSLRAWSVYAAIGFGFPEFLGMLKRGDDYPPLTFTIRRYIPRWAAFTLIYGSVGLVGSYWFQFAHPERYGFLLGLLGWFTAHFDSVYDS